MKQIDEIFTNKIITKNSTEDINPDNNYNNSKIKYSKESKKQREESLKKEKKLKSEMKKKF